MNTQMGFQSTVLRVEFPHVSPEFHPLRVKLSNREKDIYIKKNNYSLSIFHPFTLTPSRNARPCVCACIREAGGETVKLSASVAEMERGRGR